MIMAFLPKMSLSVFSACALLISTDFAYEPLRQTRNGAFKNCTMYSYSGDPCHFPFIYKGQIYDSCITADNPKAWCSLTPNYDVDKRWNRCWNHPLCEDCRVYTTKGHKCALPFTYKGRTYNHCTDRDHTARVPWCSLTPVYSGSWELCADVLCGDCEVLTPSGKCQLPYGYKGSREFCADTDHTKLWCSLNGRSATRRVDWDNCASINCTAKRNCRQYTVTAERCVFPFVYKGVKYHKCTTVDNARPWCSLTANFDDDKQWRRCAGVLCDDCTVYASNGQACVFPFTYKGKEYEYCTDFENHGKPWCSTTAVFSGQWGRCIDTLCGDDCVVPTASGKTCQFPFYYRGHRNFCTDKDNRRQPWCSLNGRTRIRGTDWDNCKPAICSKKAEIDVPPVDASELSFNGTCNGYSVYGEKCASRFIYKGVIYNISTDVDNRAQQWCGLTINVDADNKYRNFFAKLCDGCQVVTENGTPCHLPFVYKGRTYHYCTKADNPRLWCAFDAVYQTGRWGRCTARQQCAQNATA